MIFHKKSQMYHDGLITVLKLNTSYKFIQFSQLNKSLEKKKQLNYFYSTANENTSDRIWNSMKDNLNYNLAVELNLFRRK